MSWLLSIANTIASGVRGTTTPTKTTAPKTTTAAAHAGYQYASAPKAVSNFAYNPGASKDYAYTQLAQNPNSPQAYSNYVAANPTSPLQQFGNIGGSQYDLGGGSLGGYLGGSYGGSYGGSDDYSGYSGGYSPGGGGGYQGMVSAPPPPMPSFTANPPTFSRIGDYQRPDMPQVRPTDMEQAPARYQRDMTKYRKLLGEVVQ